MGSTPLEGIGRIARQKMPMPKGLIERTNQRTLLLIAALDWLDGDKPFTDVVVIQIEDRFGQIVTPNPRATDEMQQRIDDRLGHYKTKRSLSPHENTPHFLRQCEHGLTYSACTICPDPYERNTHA